LLCIAAPALPVNGPSVWIVTVTVVAELPAVIGLAGLNKQDEMPVGSPVLHVYVTLPAKVVPPVGEINIVVEVDCPGFAAGGFVRVDGTVKPCATVRAMVVLAVRLPEVPVMVTVVGPPAVAELLAVSVSTLVVAVLVGLNDAVTPLGRPDAARLTSPVNPFTSVTVMVLVPPTLPAVIVRLLGEPASVKPGVVELGQEWTRL
jgi:hypothetical protein